MYVRNIVVVLYFFSFWAICYYKCFSRLLRDQFFMHRIFELIYKQTNIK